MMQLTGKSLRLAAVLLMLPALLAAKPYEVGPVNKTWRWWRRPEKPAPDAQMAYAQKLMQAGKYRKASKEFRALVDTWPESEQAPFAQREYAAALHQRKRLDDSFNEYKFLLERYPGQAPYNETLDQMLALARERMEQKAATLLFGGFSDPLKAIPLLETIIELAPGWDKAPEVSWLIGRAHELGGEKEEAVKAYAETQYRYSDSPFAERSAFDKSYVLYNMSQKQPKDDYLAESAWTSLTLFRQTWPNSERMEKATQYRNHLFTQRARTAYEKAVFYDKTARKPDAALLAYRRFLQQFPNSGWTTLAEMRIQELTNLLEQKNANK
ncbi:MAG: outer membrane protein assembly factor BamD [Kiritimatiellia bacterium]